MQKKHVLQDPGYVKGVESACCMLCLQGCTKYPMSKESKERKNSHNTVFKTFISHVEGVKSPFD